MRYTPAEFIPRSYVFNLHWMHGDADAFTESTIVIIGNDEAQALAEKIYNGISFNAPITDHQILETFFSISEKEYSENPEYRQEYPTYPAFVYQSGYGYWNAENDIYSRIPTYATLMPIAKAIYYDDEGKRWHVDFEIVPF